MLVESESLKSFKDDFPVTEKVHVLCRKSKKYREAMTKKILITHNITVQN